MGIPRLRPGPGLLVHAVPLVERQDARHAVQLHFLEDGLHCFHLGGQLAMPGVGHQDQQVCAFKLLQGGLEGLPELLGQFPDEPKLGLRVGLRAEELPAECEVMHPLHADPVSSQPLALAAAWQMLRAREGIGSALRRWARKYAYALRLSFLQV